MWAPRRGRKRTSAHFSLLFLLGELRGVLHRLERDALDLQGLDGEPQHVEVHVEPGLDRAQLGDALLDLLRIEGRHRHARDRHAQRPPQAAEHLERILRRGLVSHGPGFLAVQPWAWLPLSSPKNSRTSASRAWVSLYARSMSALQNCSSNRR